MSGLPYFIISKEQHDFLILTFKAVVLCHDTQFFANRRIFSLAPGVFFTGLRKPASSGRVPGVISKAALSCLRWKNNLFSPRKIASSLFYFFNSLTLTSWYRSSPYSGDVPEVILDCFLSSHVESQKKKWNAGIFISIFTFCGRSEGADAFKERYTEPFYHPPKTEENEGESLLREVEISKVNLTFGNSGAAQKLEAECAAFNVSACSRHLRSLTFSREESILENQISLDIAVCGRILLIEIVSPRWAPVWQTLHRPYLRAPTRRRRRSHLFSCFRFRNVAASPLFETDMSSDVS